MIWVRLPAGDKWHLLDSHTGIVFCGCPGGIPMLGAINSETNEPPAWDDRCQNCDKRLRERGNPTKKPTRKQRYVNPRTNYRPKNRVKWD